MLAAIAAAKRSADVVVLSMHWGIHFIPRMIADYQTVAAKAAFAAGADLILGHHAHVPKAIGVYQGKVCFYSLSNFIMSSSERSKEDGERFERRYGVKLDPQYPRLPYGADAKRSLIAKAVLTRKGVERVSFLPVLIDPQLRPEVLRSGDARFEDALAYMRWASDGFACTMQAEGDEILVQ
jgi:poly-gamma-glutamate synthesis protein (capsule biosynthesis protein)